MSKLLIVTFCALAGTVQADSHLNYAVSGGWTIKVNPDNGNGCFMQRSFESGSIIQVGIVPDKDGAFFAAFNPGWTDIVQGDANQLLFDFGDSRFQGEVLGTAMDGVLGGYAFFDNPEFASEFGRRISVTIKGENGGVETFDLSGSKRAIDTVKKCQNAQS